VEVRTGFEPAYNGFAIRRECTSGVVIRWIHVVCGSDDYAAEALKYANAGRSDDSLTIRKGPSTPSWADVVRYVSRELEAAVLEGRLDDAMRWRRALGLLLDVAGRVLDKGAKS
jgi:hypothetical protein